MAAAMVSSNNKASTCNTNGSEDIDNDLPAVNLTPHKVKGFKEESIVWCKWRADFWPAFVKKVYDRQKKMQVVFADLPCDERGKEYIFKVTFRNVVKFDNSARSRELLVAGLKGCKELKDAIENVRDYVVKVGLGHLYVSPVQFLINPIDNVLAQFTAEKEKMSAKRKLLVDDENATVKKQNVDNEVISEETNSFDKVYKELCTSDVSDADERNDDEKVFAECIIKEIQTAECLDLLLKIFQGKAESNRHSWFMKGTPSERRQLKHVKFSHLMSSIQLEALITYLRKEMETRTSAPRFHILNYTLDVWLPEALVHALQVSLNISKSRAEASLLNGKVPKL